MNIVDWTSSRFDSLRERLGENPLKILKKGLFFGQTLDENNKMMYH